MNFKKALLISVAILAFVWAFICRPYKINSSGMEDTLQYGDCILTLRKFADREQKAGDVILYKGEIDSRQAIISGRIKAMPGDSLFLTSTEKLMTSADGHRLEFKTELYSYPITREDNMLSILKELGITNELAGMRDNSFLRSFTKEEAESVNRKAEGTFRLSLYQDGIHTPHRMKVPAKGDEIVIDSNNIEIIFLTLKNNTDKDIEIADGQLFTKGKKIDRIKFTEDYLWVSGDNILCATDSRTLGFIPKDKIIGRVVFRWFSSDEDGVHTERIFDIIK